MKKQRNSWIACCALLLGWSACMQETELPVKASFDLVVDGEHQTTPVRVNLTNSSTGADFYEWTFEGGEPAQSREKNPGTVQFTQPGEHRITLRAWNDLKEEIFEKSVRVDSALSIGFDYLLLVNDFAPAELLVINRTGGASTFRWTFEGGTPATSTLAHPGVVRFTAGGVHKIGLQVSNGSESVEMEREVRLQPRLITEFTMKPIPTDEDMEAPLTLKLKNESQNYLSQRWQCDGGVIADPTAAETTIRFQQPGTYVVSLLTDNQQEQQRVNKQLTIKENTGIHRFVDIRLGISQAKNSIGCLFAADWRRVLLANEVVDAAIGKRVEFGFFALNSAFDYCYFFSPDRASEAAFAPIPGAIQTTVQNHPERDYPWSDAVFEGITQAADLAGFRFSAGSRGDYFALDQLPLFTLFQTVDGRRGVIRIKQAVKSGADSYILTDIKIEKRPEE